MERLYQSLIFQGEHGLPTLLAYFVQASASVQGVTLS